MAPRARRSMMTEAVRPSRLDPEIAARLKRDASGLVAAIAQQYDTGEVLMLGWMDDEALHRTLTTGRCTYWSRSRQEYWVKGDSSGHQQWVKSVALDCDGDAVLVKVDQVGAAGGALILVSVRQRWAQAVFTPPKPLSAQVISVTGTDLVPLAGALGIAA